MPKQEQLDFLRWEFGVFFHFGIRTFYEGHKDWDMQEMPLSGFNPTSLDCNQWMEVVKDAGAQYAVLVCKHHDGFANWPSKYTDYSVANTPWKDGKGDIVQEYVDACRRHNVKVGLYYSPAEFGSMEQEAKDYDEYFINQISELLTNYGKIDYLWFDGCGSEEHKYDTVRITKVIRDLQPEILIFNMWDPDTRWVGNEQGYAHSPNEIVVNSLSFSVFTDVEESLDGDRFLPVECDFRMRRHNWFYSDFDEDTVKTIDELIGIYYYSAGRGANILINIGPDRRGVLPQADSDRLIEWGKFMKTAFANPFSTKFEKTENVYTAELAEPTCVNNLVLREDINKLNVVKKFFVRAHPYPLGAPPITIFDGKTIGNKTICVFPAFYTNKIELVIEESNGDEVLTEMSTHFVRT